jgi:hypothetical protein
MFTKIDKKVLIILIIALIAILVSVFLIYKYIDSIRNGVENTAGGIDTEEQKNEENLGKDNNLIPEIEIKTEAVTGGSSEESMLIVCLDKCGDGVCHDTKEECLPKDKNLNSICPETKEDCPQDCK